MRRAHLTIKELPGIILHFEQTVTFAVKPVQSCKPSGMQTAEYIGTAVVLQGTANVHGSSCIYSTRAIS